MINSRTAFGVPTIDRIPEGFFYGLPKPLKMKSKRIAEDIFNAKSFYNRWLQQLTDDEASQVIEMMIEAIETNRNGNIQNPKPDIEIAVYSHWDQNTNEWTGWEYNDIWIVGFNNGYSINIGSDVHGMIDIGISALLPIKPERWHKIGLKFVQDFVNGDHYEWENIDLIPMACMYCNKDLPEKSADEVYAGKCEPFCDGKCEDSFNHYHGTSERDYICRIGFLPK